MTASSPNAPLPEVEQHATRSLYMSFAEDEHPFNSWHLCRSIENSYQLDLFLPRDYFSINATKWVHFTPDTESIARNVLDLILLFSYIVSEARAKFHNIVDEPIVRPKKKKKPALQRSESRASANDEAMSPVADSENFTPEMSSDLQNTLNMRDKEDRRSGVISLLEVLPGEYPAGARTNNTRPVAGFRKRVFINNKDRFSPAYCLFQLFTANEARRRKEKTKPNPFRPPGPKPRLHVIDFERYCDLVQWYTRSTIPRNQMLDMQDIYSVDSPLNPIMAFSLVRSLDFAAQAGALDDYCNFENYIQQDASLEEQDLPSSPYNGDSMYWLKAQHDDPADVFRYCWPHIVQTAADDDNQRRLYLQGDEDSTQALAVFRLTCAQGTHVTTVNDIHALRDRQAIRREVAKQHQPQVDKADWAALMHEVEQQGLEEYMQIVNRNGDIPRSIRAICKYADKELAHHGVAMPWPKTSRDLSRFGDMITNIGCYAEAIAQTATLHADIVGTLVSIYYMYLYRDFQVNSLFAGDAMIGKSYIMKALQKALIPDTYQSVSTQSEKANALHGKEMDNSIVFYEEMQPALLGVQQGKSGHNNSGGYSTMDNVFKNSLTSGKYYHRRQVKDPETGLWKSEEVLAEVNCVYICGMNLSISELPFPMASRFHCKQMQTLVRKDGGGLLGKMQPNTNAGFKVVQREWQRRLRRTHALAAFLGYMIYSQVLPPINMTVCVTIFPEILRQAGKAGIPNWDHARHLERVSANVESLVLLEAIDIVFDSEQALVPPDTPFSMSQLLLCKPYLRATLDHVVMAIGLLSDQYEQPIQRNVIKTLKETIFAAAVQESVLIENNEMFTDNSLDVHYGYNHVNSKKYDDNYYFVPYPSVHAYPYQPGRGGSKTSNGGDAVPSADAHDKRSNRFSTYIHPDESHLINMLASELHIKMQPKPSKQSIVVQLQSLLEQKLPDKKTPHSSDLLPAMKFHDGKLWISRLLINELHKASLKDITRDVISKCIKHPRVFVWGQTLENRPYAFQTLHVVPCPPKSLEDALFVLDPTYVDPTVVKNAVKSIPANVATSDLVKNAFGKTTGWFVDGCIERMAVKMHMADSGITAASIKDWPSPLPTAYHKKLMSQIDSSTLDDYVSSNATVIIDARKRAMENIEDSYLSNKLAKLVESDLYTLAEDEEETEEESQLWAHMHMDIDDASSTEPTQSSSNYAIVNELLGSGFNVI